MSEARPKPITLVFTIRPSDDPGAQHLIGISITGVNGSTQASVWGATGGLENAKPIRFGYAGDSMLLEMDDEKRTHAFYTIALICRPSLMDKKALAKMVKPTADRPAP